MPILKKTSLKNWHLIHLRIRLFYLHEVCQDNEILIYGL